MSELGLGVMIGMLGDKNETVKAMQSAIGRTIASVVVDANRDGALCLTFTDGSTLRLYDDGRSCCESRYLTCDDDLASFVGDTLVSAEVHEAPTITSEYGDVHEQAFLRVKTNRGVIVATTHNEHNGYYGGFWMCAAFADAQAGGAA
jgi:hypothetical protein